MVALEERLADRAADRQRLGTAVGRALQKPVSLQVGSSKDLHMAAECLTFYPLAHPHQRFALQPATTDYGMHNMLTRLASNEST